MPIQQILTPPVLPFSDFVGWDPPDVTCIIFLNSGQLIFASIVMDEIAFRSTFRLLMWTTEDSIGETSKYHVT